MATATRARIVAGAVKFVTGPDYASASDYHAGCLLRLRNQPIELCANGRQRWGWRNEHARLTYVPKARPQLRYDLTTITADDLPY